MSKVSSQKLNGFLLAGILFAASAAHAVEFIQAPELTVSETETLTNELWVSADTISIHGNANEDLFAAGTTVSLHGTFAGDVWSAGDTVIASGKFDDDVRLAGRMAQVSGTLNRSLSAAGNTVKIDPSSRIGSGLLCLGENVISEGSVTGNARIVAKKATLGGTVRGDVTIAAQDIVILPGTRIGGNLNYTAPKELVLSPTVVLNGELKRIFEPAPSRPILTPNLPGHFLFALAALIAGLAFCKLFPRYSATSLHILHTASGTGMLIGLAAFVVIPMLSFFLMFTLIGLPLSILMILFYLILLYLGRIIVALWIGSLILKKKEISRRALGGTLTLGLLVIYALTAITAISLLVNILVIIIGLGAMLLALFKKPILVIQTPKDLNHTTTED